MRPNRSWNNTRNLTVTCKCARYLYMHVWGIKFGCFRVYLGKIPCPKKLVVNKHNVIKHGLNCLVIDKSIIMLEKLEALVSSIGGLVYCRAIFIT